MSRTSLPYPHGDTLHEIFRRQARRHPDTPAVVSDGRRWDYRTLDLASDWVAITLQGHGVRPGDLVAVALPRCPVAVAVLLGILKSGAAYAMLDPRWPASRRAALAGRLAAPVTVATEPLAGLPVWIPDGDLVDLTDLAARAGPVPPAPVGGDAPCTVFFTSGTTGEPKGVLSPHRGTARLFLDGRAGSFGPGTAMPLASAPAWDGYSLELWSALLTGGTCVVVTEEYLLPGRLRDLVTGAGVDRVWLTASLFNLFVDEDIDAFAGVRQVLTGGEVLSVASARRFLARHPECALINGYGPVETTVFATTHRVTAEDCRLGDIPIGRPVANTEVYLLDGDRLCGVGETGEICIGGDGVALGYLDAPELTARAFIEVDIDGRTHRVYRTGDHGRWSPQRQLHFAGRRDRQVKVRGHRIEPAEVEAAAAAVPGVSRAVAVVPRNAGGAATDLVLCYRAGPDRPIAPDELRATLAAVLPAYLMPGVIHEVRQFPLTATGKLDRRALLAEAAAASTEGKGDWAPGLAHAPDRVLAEVTRAYAEVLGVVTVGPHEPLYALGGTSLDAGRICVRLDARLGVPVPISALAGGPAPAAVAAYVRAARPPANDRPAGDQGAGDQGAGDRCAGDPQARRPTPTQVPLLPTQLGFWLAQQADPDDLTAVCTLAWRVTGPLDEDALRRSLADVAARHEALRARYLLTDAPIAEVLPTPPPDRYQRLADAADPVAARTALSAALIRPLDLEAGEVWRAAAVRVGGTDEWLVGVAVHHVAMDGRAGAVLATDLTRAYRHRLAGTAAVFDAPAPSLATIETAYRRQIAAVNLDAQRSYWRDTLAGLPDLALPVPGQAGPGGIGLHRQQIDAALVRRCDRYARAQGSSRFEVMLGAFVVALSQLTGQRDFGVGVPVSKRGSRWLADAVVCLVDTVCVRARVAAGSGFDEQHPMVRRALRDATGAQDLPFLDVVRALRVPSRHRTPLYQTLFVLQDPPPTLELPGCHTTPFQFDDAAVECDLVTEVWSTLDGGAEIRTSFRTNLVSADLAAAVDAALVHCLEAADAS